LDHRGNAKATLNGFNTSFGTDEVFTPAKSTLPFAFRAIGREPSTSTLLGRLAFLVAADLLDRQSHTCRVEDFFAEDPFAIAAPFIAALNLTPASDTDRERWEDRLDLSTQWYHPTIHGRSIEISASRAQGYLILTLNSRRHAPGLIRLAPDPALLEGDSDVAALFRDVCLDHKSDAQAVIDRWNAVRGRSVVASVDGAITGRDQCEDCAAGSRAVLGVSAPAPGAPVSFCRVGAEGQLAIKEVQWLMTALDLNEIDIIGDGQENVQGKPLQSTRDWWSEQLPGYTLRTRFAKPRSGRGTVIFTLYK